MLVVGLVGDEDAHEVKDRGSFQHLPIVAVQQTHGGGNAVLATCPTCQHASEDLLQADRRHMRANKMRAITDGTG